MAKINVEFDTKTKEMSVTMDGQAISNVEYVSLSRAYDYNSGKSKDDEYGVNIVTSEKDESEDFRTMKQIVASKLSSEEGWEPYKGSDEFVTRNVKGGSLSEKIRDYLRNHKRRA